MVFDGLCKDTVKRFLFISKLQDQEQLYLETELKPPPQCLFHLYPYPLTHSCLGNHHESHLKPQNWLR